MDTTPTVLASTTQATGITDDSEPPIPKPGQAGFVAYVLVMTAILVVGFAGNLLTIMVLSRREHKHKIITPLMLNLAFTDIVIIVFGYPVIVISNFTKHSVRESRLLCIWSGFINGSVGIASIANLTIMSLVMFNNFNKVGTSRRVSAKKMAALILVTWLYGATAMIPPLVGWNEFVPGASGISCCPNWSPDTKAAVAYNVLLVFVGFVLPLTVILCCYYRIYRLVNAWYKLYS